jgi:two-component system cell cycle sensor histidine kinase/response regulator CckA
VTHRPPLLGDARRARILVVEDERAVRDLVVRVLERAGYEVLAAGDPTVVPDLPDLDQVDLLVSDVVMPGLRGPELHARLVARHPTLRAIFMSGYFERGPSGETPIPAGTAFVAKPFTPAILVEAVRAALDPADEAPAPA